MNIKGKLLEVFDVAQVSATFRKREFVVEYVENPQYPEYLKFELIQDKCNLLDAFSIGQEIDVHFNLIPLEEDTVLIDRGLESM